MKARLFTLAFPCPYVKIFLMADRAYGRRGAQGTLMGWRERRLSVERIASALALLAIAFLAAGCFQPLYGESTLLGGRGVKEALASVDVAEIVAPGAGARMAVQIRNDLLFNFTGGGNRAQSTHLLKIA